MEILHLLIEDFCAFSKTEIDFTSFNSALIIGKKRNNEMYSNGAGKSTIFSAIKYVLFNEIDFSTLDKVIRDDCNLAKVESIIKSEDNEIYKISRKKDKKSGTDVRLFKKITNDWSCKSNYPTIESEWEDKTQRRISDTEEEIKKLLKMNYKSFCASILFTQVTGILSNIAFLTPEKKKAALREILNLSTYAKFDAITKKKISEIIKEIDKNKIKESSYINLDKEIKEIESNLISKQQLSLELSEDLKKNILSVEGVESLIKDSQRALFDLEKKILSDNSKELEGEISSLKSLIKSGELKIESFIKSGKQTSEKIQQLKKTLAALNDIDFSQIESLSNNLQNNINLISDLKIEIGLKTAKKEELLIPLPQDNSCRHCRQILTKDHIKECQKAIDAELLILNEDILKVNKKYKLIQESVFIDKEKLSALEKQKIEKEKNTELLLSLEQDLIEQRKIYNEYLEILNQNKSLLLEKETKLTKFANQQDIKSKINIEQSKSISLKNDLESLKSKTSQINKQLSLVASEEAVLRHMLSNKQDDLKNRDEVLKLIKELENKLVLHNKVSQAFGSNGIPSLILNTIVDDFQLETNNYLNKIRPDIQLQFLFVKDKDNGEQEDTFQILYFMTSQSGTHEKEFQQLSGGEKVVVAISLMLGLSCVLKRMLGVDTKMLLLDEVDQYLDEAGTDTFIDAIRMLQQEFKIIIISHNKKIKDEFEYAILVDQDDNKVSTAKVVSSW